VEEMTEVQVPPLLVEYSILTLAIVPVVVQTMYSVVAPLQLSPPLG
jgi:hypothetical protein